MSNPADMPLPVLEIKSATVYALRLILKSSDGHAVDEYIRQLDQGHRNYLNEANLIIDASFLDEQPQWPQLIEVFKKHALTILGVYASGENAQILSDCSLPRVEVSNHKVGSKPVANPAPVEVVPEPEPAKVVERIEMPQLEAGVVPYPSIVIDKPLRSGQRVYAQHADLIVLSIISNGAEVLADGNIHVYGPLRGRALAGAGGWQNAQIFTTQFNAELVSIAGIYKPFTLVPDELANRPASIKLVGDNLIVSPLSV